jgi:hypothetical protein
VERIPMRKISALHTPRSRKHLYKQDSIANQKHANPYIHHTSPQGSKAYQLQLKLAAPKENMKPHKGRRMDSHKARKLFNHNQRGEFGDN